MTQPEAVPERSGPMATIRLPSATSTGLLKVAEKGSVAVSMGDQAWLSADDQKVGPLPYRSVDRGRNSIRF